MPGHGCKKVRFKPGTNLFAGVPSCAQTWKRDKLAKFRNDLVKTIGEKFRTTRQRTLSVMQVGTKASYAKREALLNTQFSRRCAQIKRSHTLKRAPRKLKSKAAKRLRKKLKKRNADLNALKQEKCADAALIENLVKSNDKQAEQIEKLHLVNDEKEALAANLRADMEPLQFEIETMRDRIKSLQRELRELKVTPVHCDHEPLIHSLRAQNQVMRSKISALKSQLHAVRLDKAKQIGTLRVHIGELKKKFNSKAPKKSKLTKPNKSNVKRHSARPKKSLSGFGASAGGFDGVDFLQYELN